MRVSNVKLNAIQISGNTEGTGLLIGMTAGFDYVDGKRTDNQSHIKYEVVFPDNAFEKVPVRVPGMKSAVTEEQLAQQSGKVKVKFKNLTGKFYRANSGEYLLTCRADSVEVVQ